jgi:hypothetical protein
VNGYELPIAMEVRRGRYLTSYERPQKFVPSIYEATAADFVKATQRVYCSPSLPSHGVLPVVPQVEGKTTPGNNRGAPDACGTD